MFLLKTNWEEEENQNKEEQRSAFLQLLWDWEKLATENQAPRSSKQHMVS